MITDLNVPDSPVLQRALNLDTLRSDEDSIAFCKIASIKPMQGPEGQPYLRFSLRDRYGRAVSAVKFDAGDYAQVSKIWTQFMDRIVSIEFTASIRYNAWSLNLMDVRGVTDELDKELRDICFNGIVEGAEIVYQKLISEIITNLHPSLGKYAKELDNRGFLANIKLYSDDVLANGRRGGLLLLMDSIWNSIKYSQLSGIPEEDKGMAMFAYIFIKCFIIKNRPGVSVGEGWKIDCIKKSDIVLSDMSSSIPQSLFVKLKELCETLLALELGFASSSSNIASTLSTLNDAFYKLARVTSKMESLPFGGIIQVDKLYYKK